MAIPLPKINVVKFGEPLSRAEWFVREAWLLAQLREIAPHHTVADLISRLDHERHASPHSEDDMKKKKPVPTSVVVSVAPTPVSVVSVAPAPTPVSVVSVVSVVSAVSVVSVPIDPVPDPDKHPPVPSTARVVQGSDLTYLGCFSLPAGMQAVFPTGPCSLAGRRVNGQLRFFSASGYSDLWEYTYPGVGTTVGAVRATAIRHWGDYAGLVRRDAMANPPQESNNYLGLNGIYWYEAGKCLLWTYWDGYNAVGRNDPSIGLTELNDATGMMTTHGPWSTTDRVHRVHSYFCEPDTTFSNTYLHGAKLAVGSSGIASGAASSPWGMSLFSLQSQLAPALSTATPIPVVPLLAHDQAHRQARKNTDYVLHDIPPYLFQNPDPTQDWSQRDGNEGTNLGACSMVWINTPTRRGAIFFSYIATKHIWYGVLDCGHGFVCDGPDDGYGPHSSGGVHTSSTPMAWIYDPAALAPIATGSTNPWAVPPTEMVDLQAKGLIRSGQGKSFDPNQYDYARIPGAYFDPVESLVFLLSSTVEFGGDNNGGHPIVNVFKLN